MADKGFWDANGNWVESTLCEENGGNEPAKPAESSGSMAVEGTAAIAERGMEVMKVLNGGRVVRKETEETKKLKEKYHFFGPITAAYALFYAFCTYKNGSGITFPFFVASSFLYFYYSLKKLELTLKKGVAFYAVSMMLLAIATFCTDDARIIALNKTGIFLLMISFLLNQFHHTEKWGLGKYLTAIPGVFLYSIGQIARPIQDMVGFAKNGKSKNLRNALYVLFGMAITLPIFMIAAVLLSSADVFFRSIVEQTMGFMNFDNLFGVIFQIVFCYFATYALVATLCKRTIRDEVKDHRNGEPILAITVTAALSLMYLLFSGIQIFGLFLGKLELPDGYTYAEYAREGFFQLLAVSIMNLVIVLACMAFFKESKVLKGILTIMSLCTFVMIASSALRMILYISTYDLTFLRILTLWALTALFFLFLGVMIQIFRKNFPLFRYGMTVVTILYVALAFSHPDFIVAKYNLEYSIKDPVDVKYLSELSADAAPVILPYLREQGYDLSQIKQTDARIEAQREEIRRTDRNDGETKKSSRDPWLRYLKKMQGYYRDQGIRNFNLSRSLALREAK